MQATATRRLMISAARAVRANSCPDKGRKFSMVRRLSSICSRELMPERTIMTFSWLAAKRIAQEGMERSGAASFSMASASAGRRARVPPFTGSITTTAFPCFSAVS